MIPTKKKDSGPFFPGRLNSRLAYRIQAGQPKHDRFSADNVPARTAEEGQIVRAVERVLQLFEKIEGAVSVFAGPMSFTAGGPNPGGPASLAANYPRFGQG